MASLSLLPDGAERGVVPRRRLEFPERPESFFDEGERPLRTEEPSEPYHRGMLRIARATNRAERRWLREMLDGSEQDR
ncbi:hypothetical protein FHX42_001399 [Saccharopolyspora lacisalsi]|uniref:Uncharacterized protein n=1 Tax=Halosaccharopolyspora lacisalsi TaxID=1000566 RepID=A0A839DSZ5_9PSEU|nr:hypothetical protein [Halosaccharopolyspora lacisalsi]MBA8824070.1 hypothetical protein [Halosaccharopolyspora lacisalsi]